MIKIFISLIILSFSSLMASEKAIAQIPEASGICYSKISDSLFIANDEGTIFEISTNGKVLKEKYIGDYDLEGVACDDEKGLLLFAVEGKDNILVVLQENLEITKEVSIKRKFKGIKLLKKNKKHGLEAITIADGKILLSNQSKKKWPDEDASVVFEVENIESEKTKIKKIYDHGYIDIAGLTYKDEKLYMVSDKKNLLIVYDLKNEYTIKTVKLPEFAQEGICFDKNNALYIADDEGQVFKFDPKKLGI